METKAFFVTREDVKKAVAKLFFDRMKEMGVTNAEVCDVILPSADDEFAIVEFSN